LRLKELNEQEKEQERIRLHRMFALERELHNRGYRLVAGVDEVGRGPLAGPVVACAVIFTRECPLYGLKDSKLLSPRQREILLPQILRNALTIGIGIARVEEIDKLNIHNAALQAMARAVSRLSPAADYILVDGRHKISLTSPAPQKAIKGGDRISLSIAAASVVAKVVRDRFMISLGERYPSYGFEKHKGYPTAEHREAIARFGALPVHRRSFKLLGKKEFFHEPLA
jgi:ribonuclease HII